MTDRDMNEQERQSLYEKYIAKFAYIWLWASYFFRSGQDIFMLSIG